jgi:cyclophilin family peptidyl-prolyl cis-trans isomerase
VSSNRRQQQRDQQRRQRRTQRRQSRQNQNASFESIGSVEFTGPMGFMQRHTRWFFLGGIIVMVLSLGSIIFATQLGGAAPDSTAPDSTVNLLDDAAPDDGATVIDPADEIVRVYDAAPELTIDPQANHEAVLYLESGEVRIELYADQAPVTVNNFVFLARNRFYEGLTFHRVIPGFVAQGGDPTGAGSGSPGYVLDDESNLLQFERGVLSMAESVTGQVNGSQFFVTLGPTPHLNGDFIVFGRVIEGLELLDELAPRDPSQPGQQDGNVILSIEITEGGA